MGASFKTTNYPQIQNGAHGADTAPGLTPRLTLRAAGAPTRPPLCIPFRKAQLVLYYDYGRPYALKPTKGHSSLGQDLQHGPNRPTDADHV